MAALEGKTALVTGASRGIGRATACALAGAGAHVLVHYGRSVQDAESLVSDIHAKGGRAEAIRADMGTPDGATQLAKKVRAIAGDRMDVLVLNAGISKAATIKDHTIEDFDNLFAINVRSPFFLVQQLLPVLGEGSSIIVISSIGAHAVVGKPSLDKPSILAYASTKGALETLVKNWAALLGPQGIRVNAVAPGVIDTDMSNFAKTDAGRQMTLGMQALKRIGRPEDVADVVTFLASDAARWIRERAFRWTVGRSFKDPSVLPANWRKYKMTAKVESKNKTLVLEAFDTLFNKRDYAAAEGFWSPDYIQHSAHIAPGREGLFDLIKGLPPTLKYEPGTIVAEGDLVIVHGRFSNFGLSVNWIAADIVRIQNGLLVEHWDVIQDEATEERSASKRPMFGTTFATYN